MNFLSHYYFDRNQPALKIVGSLLPDLIKNAGVNKVKSPLKNTGLLENNLYTDLLAGWRNHIEVDKYFHSSDFFIHHSQALKEEIKEVTVGSEVRPSFLGHIALELILDHLLIQKNKIQVGNLYIALQEADKETIASFLLQCTEQESDRILNFIQNFNASKYLLSYQKMENIAYALNRICMRLWPVSLNEENVALLFKKIDSYAKRYESELMQIFPEIESCLKKH